MYDMDSKKEIQTTEEAMQPWQTHGVERMKQKYFSISEVAKIFDLEEHTLRYWEKETPLQPRRSPSSNARMYEHKDLDIIERIIYLMQVKGMTLNAAAEQLDNPIVNHDLEILGRLLKLRERLSHLTETINSIAPDDHQENQLS